MALLLDLTPEGREVPPPADDDLADPSRRTLQMLGLGLLGVPRYPFRMLRALPEGDPEPRGHAVRRLPGHGHGLARGGRAAPRRLPGARA